MALVIPASASTYGDSTTTEGGMLRKYVLAQFRSDSDLEWVRETRSLIGKDELKYKDFLSARPRLRENHSLWMRIEHGIGQATIIVIDPEPVKYNILFAALANEADPEFLRNKKLLTEECAIAIIAGTPISYLPLNLAQAVPWGLYDHIANLEQFLPEAIKSRIGGGLKQAQIFAARAHATFDLPNANNSDVSTDSIFKSPLSQLMLTELLATTRTYDHESPSTLPVLNEAATEIAKAAASFLPEELIMRASKLFSEVDSRAIPSVPMRVRHFSPNSLV